MYRGKGPARLLSGRLELSGSAYSTYTAYCALSGEHTRAALDDNAEVNIETWEGGSSNGQDEAYDGKA